jgi:hypothetical protein
LLFALRNTWDVQLSALSTAADNQPNLIKALLLNYYLFCMIKLWWRYRLENLLLVFSVIMASGCCI